MKKYAIGLYEKAMHPGLNWREKLAFAKESGYDFVEISIDEKDEKLARLRRCRREMDGLKQEAEAIEAEVKAELEARGVEQVETAHYRVSWKTVTSTRLDAKALRAERPEIYERYAVTGSTKRFTVT